MAGHHNHGHTPAAWTGVTIVILGFCLGGFYTVMAEPLGVAAGAGVAALGGVVGLVMRSMGLGAEKAPLPPQPKAAVAADAEADVVAEAEATAEEAAEAEEADEPAKPVVGRQATAEPAPQQAAAGG
jgi:hypothetical protein